MNSANPSPSQPGYQPGYQPSPLPPPSHATFDVAQPSNNQQVQNQIPSTRSNLLITHGALHLICGFIPLIPIAVLIGGTVPFFLLSVWMCITGITGLVFGYHDYFEASNHAHNVHNAHNVVLTGAPPIPHLKAMRMLVGMMGGVMGFIAVAIIHGAVVVNTTSYSYSQPSSYTASSSSGVVAIAFSACLLFLEIPQLIILKHFARGNRGRPGYVTNNCSAVPVQPIVVGGFHPSSQNMPGFPTYGQPSGYPVVPPTGYGYPTGGQTFPTAPNPYNPYPDFAQQAQDPNQPPSYSDTIMHAPAEVITTKY